jgi:predicted TIM-barrel fold metal-dependent hydrolase
MLIIDSQVHIWDRDLPERSWGASFRAAMQRPDSLEARLYSVEPVPAARVLQAMQETGVDRAILVSSNVYGFDPSYALAAAKAHPDRFRAVARLDPNNPHFDVSAWAKRPEAAGLRVLAMDEAQARAIIEGAFSGLLAEAEKHTVPVCIYVPTGLEAVGRVAAAFPGLTLVVDHLGLPRPDPRNPDPFATLPELLTLARFPNVMMKLTNLPCHSREAFPFKDVAPVLDRFVAAFGYERLLWGTDWTRPDNEVGLAEGLQYIAESPRFSSRAKELMLGLNAQRVFWRQPS